MGANSCSARVVTYRESWKFDLTPVKQSLLEPCSATIYRIALSKLFLEQIAFSTGIPHLQGQQNDQREQYIPTMHRKRNSANGQIDKHVHGVLQAQVQTVRYEIIGLWSHSKRLA